MWARRFFLSPNFPSSFQLNSEYLIDMGKHKIFYSRLSLKLVLVFEKSSKEIQDPNLKLIQSDLIDIRMIISLSKTTRLSGNVSVIFFNAFCQQSSLSHSQVSQNILVLNWSILCYGQLVRRKFHPALKNY